MDKFLIIDGSSLLSTSYYGSLPDEIKFAKTKEEKQKHYDKLLKSNDGLFTNAINSFLFQMGGLIKSLQPKYFAVCWDLQRDTTFRKKLYPEYKAQRGQMETPLLEQFNHCQKLLEYIGVSCYMSDEFEADDFAGSLGASAGNGVEVIYVTKDLDYLQLISETSSVYTLVNNSSKLYEALGVERDVTIPKNMFVYNSSALKLLKGLSPEQVIDFKALAGDKSDNIPGVAGVGETTAMQLLANFGDIEHIYKFLEETPDDKETAKKLKEACVSRICVKKLRDGKDNAFLFKELCTIRKDVLSEFSLNDVQYSIDTQRLRKILGRLSFGITRIDELVNRLS